MTTAISTGTEESNGELDQLAGDLYALVSHLGASSNRDLLDAIAREELTLSQLRLLERLRAGARPAMHEAAAMIGISRAGISRLVTSLALRGMVRREDDQADYRAKRLIITDRGREAITRLHPCRLDAIAQFANSLGEDQRARLHAAIRRALPPRA